MEHYENQSNSNLDLAQFDDAFETAEVEEREFEAVPDGKYQVNVDRVELTRAQTSGNPMLKWTLRVLAPTHKGRLLWRNNVMASNENIKWLKQDLYTCGLQLQKLSDLPGHLEQLLNIKLEVTKRTRGENENIYFNRRIVMADDAGAPGAAMDDMIPLSSTPANRSPTASIATRFRRFARRCPPVITRWSASRNGWRWSANP